MVKRLERDPRGFPKVIVDLFGVRLVDHTFLERLHAMSQEWPEAELGLDAMRAPSHHPLAARRRAAAS